MRLRRTKGIGLLSMKRFCITDDWTQTLNAHRLLDEPWIGTTTFQDIADYMMESDDSTTTTGQAGAQRSEPTTRGAMTAATIFIVDGQPGATRSEPTAIKDHGLQTSTKEDTKPPLGVLSSRVVESHGVSNEVRG